MINSGKFNTFVKSKIKTLHGNILKFTHYNSRDEEQPYDEYKIRPKCSYCKGDVGCICYNYNNSDDPLQSAIEGLQQSWTCEKIDCLISNLKEYDQDLYKKLLLKFGDDKWSIIESFQEKFSDDGEDIFCEI